MRHPKESSKSETRTENVNVYEVVENAEVQRDILNEGYGPALLRNIFLKNYSEMSNEQIKVNERYCLFVSFFDIIIYL